MNKFEKKFVIRDITTVSLVVISSFLIWLYKTHVTFAVFWIALMIVIYCILRKKMWVAYERAEQLWLLDKGDKNAERDV